MFLISKGVVDGISYKKETKVQYVHQEFWTTTSTLKEKILHGIFFFHQKRYVGVKTGSRFEVAICRGWCIKDATGILCYL